MAPVCEMPICGSCGADWAADDWTPGCDECGGGAMTRACPVCGGACGRIFQRDIAATHEDGVAVWQGSCAG